MATNIADSLSTDNYSPMFIEFARRWGAHTLAVLQRTYPSKYIPIKLPAMPNLIQADRVVYAKLKYDKDEEPLKYEYFTRTSTQFVCYAWSFADSDAAAFELIKSIFYVGKAVEDITKAILDGEPIFYDARQWLGRGRAFESIKDVPKYDAFNYGVVPEGLLFRKGCEIAWSQANARRFYNMKAEYILYAYYYFRNDAVWGRVFKNIITHAIKCREQHATPLEKDARYVIELAKAYHTFATIDESIGIPAKLCFANRIPPYMVATQEYGTYKENLGLAFKVDVDSMYNLLRGSTGDLPAQYRDTLRRFIEFAPRTTTNIKYDPRVRFCVPTDNVVGYVSTADANNAFNSLMTTNYPPEVSKDFVKPTEFIAILTSSMSFMKHCYASHDATSNETNPKYLQFGSEESAARWVRNTHKKLVKQIPAEFIIYYSLKVKCVGGIRDYTVGVFDSNGNCVCSPKALIKKQPVSKPEAAIPYIHDERNFPLPRSSKPPVHRIIAQPKGPAVAAQPKGPAKEVSAKRPAVAAQPKEPAKTLSEDEITNIKNNLRKAKFEILDVLDEDAM